MEVQTSCFLFDQEISMNLFRFLYHRITSWRWKFVCCWTAHCFFPLIFPYNFSLFSQTESSFPLSFSLLSLSSNIGLVLVDSYKIHSLIERNHRACRSIINFYLVLHFNISHSRRKLPANSSRQRSTSRTRTVNCLWLLLVLAGAVNVKPLPCWSLFKGKFYFICIPWQITNSICENYQVYLNLKNE